MLLEQNRCEFGSHGPFDEIGEHAQEYTGFHAVASIMMQGSDSEIGLLFTAEG